MTGAVVDLFPLFPWMSCKTIKGILGRSFTLQEVDKYLNNEEVSYYIQARTVS